MSAWMVPIIIALAQEERKLREEDDDFLLTDFDLPPTWILIVLLCIMLIPVGWLLWEVFAK